MGEPKGPGGLKQEPTRERPLESTVARATETKLPFGNVEDLVDEIISSISEAPNKTLEVEDLINMFVSKGVPANFFSVYGRTMQMSLSIILTGLRQNPQAPGVRQNFINLFKKETDMARFTEVAQDPASYFETASLALVSSEISSIESFSVEQINSLSRAFLNIQGKGLNTLRQAAQAVIIKEVKSVFGKNIIISQVKDEQGSLYIENGCTPAEGQKIQQHINSVLPHIKFSPYNFLEKNKNSKWYIELFPVTTNIG